MRCVQETEAFGVAAARPGPMRSPAGELCALCLRLDEKYPLI